MPGELAGGQSGAELDQRQRVAAGLGDEPVLNALVHRTLGHRRQQLAGRGRGQPLDRQLVQAVEGQPPSGRLPDGEEEGQRIRLRPTGDEGQHLGRLPVQPLCVVHDAHQGDRGRGVGQQRQDRQADQHPSGRGGRAQAEDGLQRVSWARVRVDGEIVGQIERGWAILLGIGPEDSPEIADGLTRREHDILAFERQWWKFAGVKEEAIKELFSMSATRYYQVLNALVDRPEALAADPMLVKRLRRLRASRQKARAARRLGFEVT